VSEATLNRKHVSIRVFLITLMMVLVVAVNPIPNQPLTPNAHATGITRIQGNARGVWVSGSSFTVTMSSAPTNGNSLVLTIVTVGTSLYITVTSISQTGATWNSQVSNQQYVSSYYRYTEIWLASNVQSAGTVITISLNVDPQSYGGAKPVANVCEYSGISNSSPLDKSATAQGTATSLATGTTVATTQANEVWVGSINDHSAGSQSNPTNGFTLLDGANGGGNINNAYLEKIVSSTGTANSETYDYGTNGWVGAIATFKAAPASASPSDSLVQSDGVVRKFGAKRVNPDAASVTDLISRLHRVPKRLSDVVAWQDTITRVLSGNKFVLSDVLKITAALSYSYYSTVTHYVPSPLSDILEVNEQLGRQYFGTASLSDVLGWADSLTKLRNVPIILSSVLGITDSLTHLGPPAAPSSVSATQNPTNPQSAIDLTWSESDTYAGMTYYIEKSIDSSTWVTAGTSTTTSYTASGLASGVGWYFRIRAYNGQYSPYSLIVLGVTSSGTTLPGGGSQPTPSYALVVKVADLNGTPVQSASVTVGSWSLLSDSTGLANFGTLQSSTYLITVSASACQPTNQTINLNSNHDSSNPLQVSLTCGTQQATGSRYTIPQIEGLILPILGISLLAIAGVAYFESRRRKTRKKREST
jgi:hypothetical protein